MFLLWLLAAVLLALSMEEWYLSQWIERQRGLAAAGGALLMMMAWNAVGSGKMLLPSFLFLLLLLGIGRVDQKRMIIPDSLSFAVFLCALMRLVAEGSIPSFFLGGLVVSLPMLLLICWKKDSFGGGDVKLCFAGGCFLGMEGMLTGWLLALLIGSVWSLFQLMKRKLRLRQKVPFAPFLCLAMGLSVLWGEWIFRWYAHLFF